MNPAPVPDSTATLAQRTYRWEGLVFNVTCDIYFVLLAPLIVSTADAVMRQPGVTAVWLGVLILAISLAELWAFPVKMRFVNQAVRTHGDSAGSAFMLWLFHAVISVILVMLIAECFGAEIGEGDDSTTWMAIVMPIVVIKELVFLFVLMAGIDDDSEPLPRYTRPQRREWLADAILVVYACVVYSASWGSIMSNADLEPHNLPMYVLNLFVASLLFLIFYLPLRIPYWIEELAQVDSTGDRLRLVGSILIALVPAVAIL